jgi:outer membrane protein
LPALISKASGQAPSPKPAEESARVAVVEFQPAVTATNEFQRDLAALQKKYEPKKTELKTASDEIESLTKQLQADAGKLSEPEQAARAKSIDDKKKRAQRLADDAEGDYEQEAKELFGRIADKVGALLTDYAKGHGFTLVMDRSEQEEGPVVLYASDSTDITRQIVDAYNAKSGVAAQPAGLPGAPQPSASR